MEEEVVALLGQTFDKSANSEQIAGAEAKLQTLMMTSDIYPTLFSILMSSEIRDEVRTSCLYYIANTVGKRWSSIVGTELESYIIDNFVQFLKDVPDSMLENANFISNVIVQATYVSKSWTNLPSVMYHLLIGSQSDIRACLFLACPLAKLIKANFSAVDRRCPEYLYEFASSFSTSITHIFVTSPMFSKVQCLSIAAKFCLLDLPNFLTSSPALAAKWINHIIECLSQAQDPLFASFLSHSLKLISSLIYHSSVLPLAEITALISGSSSLAFLFPKAILQFIKLLQICNRNESISPFIEENIIDWSDNLFSPLFSLSREDILAADLDPPAFAANNYFDDTAPISHDPSRQIFHLLSEVNFPAFLNHMFQHLCEAISEYNETRDPGRLYSISHMCSAAWPSIIKDNEQEAAEFLTTLKGLTDDGPTLAQASFLLFLARSGKVDVSLLLSYLCNQKELIQYFAATALCRALIDPTEFDASVSDSAHIIVERVISCIERFTAPNLADILVFMVKDPTFLSRVTEFAPTLVQHSLRLAAYCVEERIEVQSSPIVNTILNLIFSLRGQPQALQPLIHVTFASTLELAATISQSTLLLDVFGAIVQFTPSIVPEHWQLFDVLLPYAMSGNNLSVESVFTTFHNIILKDKENASSPKNAESLIKVASEIMNERRESIISLSPIFLIPVMFVLPAEYKEVEAIGDFIQATITEIPGEDEPDSLDAISKILVALFAKFPHKVKESLGDRLFEFIGNWIPLAKSYDAACFLLSSFQWLPLDVIVDIIRSVVEEGPNSILESDEIDADEFNYMRETGGIEIKAIPLFPPEEINERFACFLDEFQKQNASEAKELGITKFLHAADSFE